MRVFQAAIMFYIHKNHPKTYGFVSYGTESNEACTVVEEPFGRTLSGRNKGIKSTSQKKYLTVSCKICI